MKLIKRVQQLEQSERVEQAIAAGIAIAWSTDEQRAADLADEEVAMDIHILSNEVAGVDPWRTVERRRRDAEDLGDVFDAAGVRIGGLRSGMGVWFGGLRLAADYPLCGLEIPYRQRG